MSHNESAMYHSNGCTQYGVFSQELIGEKVHREIPRTSAGCNSRPRICSLDPRSCVLSDQQAEREIACSQSSKDVAKVIGKYEPILSGAGRRVCPVVAPLHRRGSN